MCFTGFYWVLLFYWVFIIYTGFYGFLLGLTRTRAHFYDS